MERGGYNRLSEEQSKRNRTLVWVIGGVVSALGLAALIAKATVAAPLLLVGVLTLGVAQVFSFSTDA